MDSQDRDETKIRRRQELLARRVGEALDQMKPHGLKECPDAEVIAAYAEQTLAPGTATSPKLFAPIFVKPVAWERVVS